MARRTCEGWKDRGRAQCSRKEQSGLFRKVEFTAVDREGIIRAWNATLAPVAASFPVRGMIPIPGIQGVQEAYLALAPAPEFVDNILTDENKRIRVAVFEQNVRAFLGDENPVNVAIRGAIQDATTHDRFATLNNGLTIVAPDVRVQSERVSLSNFQIVNGCQTSRLRKKPLSKGPAGG